MKKKTIILESWCVICRHEYRHSGCSQSCLEVGFGIKRHFSIFSYSDLRNGTPSGTNLSLPFYTYFPVFIRRLMQIDINSGSIFRLPFLIQHLVSKILEQRWKFQLPLVLIRLLQTQVSESSLLLSIFQHMEVF